MIDATITLGSLIDLFALVVAGIVGFAMLKSTVGRLASDVVDMKTDIRALNKVIIEMAVTHTRLDNLEQDIKELRHGRGFIREAVEGEWPQR